MHILNCYTQYDYRRGKVKVHANYVAIEECFKEVSRRYDAAWEIRLPKIGCGLAGGNWEIVSGLLENTLGHKNIKVYFL